MPATLPTESLNQLFVDAHTHTHFTDKPVSDDTLHQLYELLKWGPSSANSSPARFVFVKSPQAKEKLLPCVIPQNAEKVKSAPVTAILAMDSKFYDQLPRLYPVGDFRSYFVNNKPLTDETAFRNSSLQGAYMIIAARALGLDCGPMSGFDNAKLDEAFFKDAPWKSNFICNIGYGDHTKVHLRMPRLAFDEACKIA